MANMQVDVPSNVDLEIKKLNMSNSPEKKKIRSGNELANFDEVFPTLVNNLTKHGMKDDEISDAVMWFKKVSEYNVPHGKKNRGLTVVHSYKYLVKDPTEEDLHIARVVGWCAEWLQAFFLVADDIMDQSMTRRGQKCWYRQSYNNKSVGLEAINDAFYLESAVYCLLKEYCRGKPYYIDLVDLFHETTLQTITGQCLDMLTPAKERGDFTNYTIPKYNAIVKYKTAFYSFYLPVASAMFMAGITDDEAHSCAKSILLKMGEFFQIQDDYLDCFGDPNVTGKIGTDIEDNKCSWLMVQALQRANSDQLKRLQENYAQNDEEKVAKVKEVFRELSLQQVYAKYEESSYNELIKLIDNLNANLPKEMFVAFSKKIYKRDR